MTGGKRGVKVGVEEMWKSKVIEASGEGGSGGPKLRDGGKALEERCGGPEGGNEEHGR